nr:integrase, catalytic region, zinc finger, CCHC-type, peptidase aspartic, catalytic [Tanacetum cinerariifolium]
AKDRIRLHHGKTPYELLHNKLHNLSYLHVFGALCYPSNDSEKLVKLQQKADIGIFIVQAESTSSPSSTTVDQDEPSPSKSQTTPETQSSVIPQDVEEDIHDIEVTHMGNDPLFGVPIPEVTSVQSSSTISPHTIGEGSGTLTKPHHTPSQEAQPSSHTHISSPSIPTVSSVPTALIPTVTPSETTPIRQYTRRPRIAQSSTLPLVTDKHASRLRDVSQGEACPTESGFIADQDRTTIAKSSTLPHDSATRVTSPAAAQEVEINKLKERVKLLEDGKRMAVKGSGDDAPIKRRRFDEEEVATERVSNDTEEIRLDEGEIVVPTASTTISTATPIFATATTVTPYTRRKGKEKMVETHTPKKKKRVQEKIDIQFSRELEEELEREAQRMNAQISRDEEIAKIHPEEELQQMIAVKETLSIRPATDEKEMELWVELKRLYEPDVEDHLWTHSQHIMHAPIDWRLYGTCGVHHVMFKDLEIFMLVEKNYPLRKALAFVMICYKLQVENYSQMATDLVRKIQQIAGTPSLGGLLGIKCTRHSYYQLQSSHYQKNFPLPKKKEDRTAINVKKKLPVKDGS